MKLFRQLEAKGMVVEYKKLRGREKRSVGGSAFGLFVNQ